MNNKSRTLREFILRLTSKKGDRFVIKYGYDASAKHSGCYIKASINGGEYSSTKKVLNRVRSLKIELLNRIIDSVGTDITGAPYNYEERSVEILDSTDWRDITSFYRIETEAEETALENYIEKYAEASEKAQKGITRRYNNSRRLAFLEKSRALLKGIRDLYWNGVTIDKKTFIPTPEGILKTEHIPFYYKRDIDYLRKARFKVFTKVLKRKYIPFK